jgi:hypothetical protein
VHPTTKHENSGAHLLPMSKWLILGQRLLEGKTIDYEKQLRVQEDGEHWQGFRKVDHTIRYIKLLRVLKILLSDTTQN